MRLFGRGVGIPISALTWFDSEKQYFPTTIVCVTDNLMHSRQNKNSLSELDVCPGVIILGKQNFSWRHVTFVSDLSIRHFSNCLNCLPRQIKIIVMTSSRLWNTIWFQLTKISVSQSSSLHRIQSIHSYHVLINFNGILIKLSPSSLDQSEWSCELTINSIAITDFMLFYGLGRRRSWCLALSKALFSETDK